MNRIHRWKFIRYCGMGLFLQCLLGFSVAAIASEPAWISQDSLRVLGCPKAHSYARGVYKRYRNSAGEWVSYANRPVYRFKKSGRTYQIYYQSNTGKWVLDKNALGSDSNGVASTASTQFALNPTESNWTNSCRVFPGKISVYHPTNFAANGTYNLSGTNKGQPKYVKGGWSVYYHGNARAWVVDSNKLSNSSLGGVVSKGTKNQKNIILAKWNNLVKIKNAGRPKLELGVGFTHSCWATDGDVRCWGKTNKTRSTPKDLAGLNQHYGLNLVAPTMITANRYHTCVLDAGNAKCWAEFSSNNYGQAPATKTLNKPRDISAGLEHTCALDDDGLKCWGRNNQSQAPQNNAELNLLGVTLNGPFRVAAADSFSCALDSDGIKCWGAHPLPASGSVNLAQAHTLSASGQQVCALDNNGVHCWGNFNSNDEAISNSSELITKHGITLNNPSHVGLSRHHACVIDDDGAKCWGRNLSGEAPQLNVLRDASALSLGDSHSCAADDEGVKCWGDSQYLQMDVPHSLANGYIHPWATDPDHQSGDCAKINLNGTWAAASCSAGQQPFACFDRATHQWQVTQQTGTWYRGQRQCHLEFGPDAIFASPHSESGNSELTQLLTSDTWINMTDQAHEGVWQLWASENFTDLLSNPSGEWGNLAGWSYSGGLEDKAFWSVNSEQGHANFLLQKPVSTGLSPITRTQTVDLIQRGWTTEELNQSPPILITQEYQLAPSSTFDGCLNVDLLDGSNRVVASWGGNTEACRSVTNSGGQTHAEVMSHRFEAYPGNVRKIRWTDTIYQGEDVAIGQASLRVLTNEDISTSMASRRILARSGQLATDPRNINKVSITIKTGSNGTDQTVSLGIYKHHTVNNPHDALVNRESLNHWGNDFEAGSEATYEVPVVPQRIRESYTGVLGLSCALIFNDSWEIGTIKLKLNDVVVVDQVVNKTISPGSCTDEWNDYANYVFDIHLPDELKIYAIDTLADAKQSIETALTTANGGTAYSLNQNEIAELFSVYDYYQNQRIVHANDPAKLALLDQEEQEEYHQRIAYFQIDHIWQPLYARLQTSSERTEFNALKTRLEKLVLIQDLGNDGFTELAEEFATDIPSRFNAIIEERVCAAPNTCSDKVTEAEIHQALLWSQLVYENKDVINQNIYHGLDHNNVYASANVKYVVYDSIWGGESEQVFVASVERSGAGGIKDIVIAFRGTQTWSDIFTDANDAKVAHELFQNDAGTSNIKVHQGFQTMWKYHKAGVTQALDELIDGSIDDVKTIYITGHSLGAAVATVGAPYIAYYLESNYQIKDPKRLKVIHFGSPRTGNQQWVDHFNTMDDYFGVARVWLYKDIIAAVPFERHSWRHIGSSVQLNSVPPALSTAVWPTNWFSKEHIGDALNWAYLHLPSWSGGTYVGTDLKNHMTEAYKFSVDRELITLPIIRQHQDEAENCIAINAQGVLSDEPCESSHPFLCENLKTITLGTGAVNGVGKGSVAWDNSWSVSDSASTWYNNDDRCIGNTFFSVPSGSSDINAIKNIMPNGKVWVNYSRNPLH